MDKMLVRHILMFLGIAVGCNCLSIDTDVSLSKNDSLLDFKSVEIAKPKRQLDNFDFDLGSFEGSSFFKADKSDEKSSLEILDTEDFSGFSPTASKVTRSNVHDLGTHGANFDSSSLSSENYESDSEATQKHPEIHADYYSNEDQSALSQSQTSTTNNLGTSPHYSNISNQPKFIPTKPIPPTLQYNTYAPLTEYVSNNPIYSTSSQLPLQTVSPTHPITYAIPYKAQYSHPSKLYAPLPSHNVQQQQYGVPYQNAYNNIHLTTTPTVGFNGKKLALPLLQLQTEVPNYVQAFKNPPIIFGSGSGLQYKTQPGLGLSFDFAKPKNHNQRLGSSAPFVIKHNSATTQVLPLKTSGSTAQFPQYKGASVSQFPNREFSVIPNDYQEFKLQPQLHFSKHTNNKNNGYNNGYKSYQKPGIYSSPPAQIKSDVEIIDKKTKKPPPPSKNGDGDDDKDDDNSDEADYSGKDTYYSPKDDDDDKASRKGFKESELESDFVPSKSYPFKEYDKKFSKSKKSNFDNDDDDGEDDDEGDLSPDKYRYSANSEDDDDNDDDDDDDESKDENKSFDDEPKSKYRSHPIEDSYKKHHGSDNDEFEENGGTKGRKNYSKNSERSRRSKKTRRHPRKERGRNNEEKYEHGEKYHKPTEFDVNYSKSGPNHRRPSSDSKNKYRAYRDESGEPSTRPISFSSLQNDANFDLKTKAQSNNQSKMKKWPQITRKNSYGTRIEYPDDDGDRLSYSQEEAAAMHKHLNPRSTLTTTQEYTTRPAHKTSTILSKGPTNVYPSKPTESTMRHRPTRRKEDKQPISSTQRFFNLDFN